MRYQRVTRATTGLLLAALLAVGVLAAPAPAASPPTGSYDCSTGVSTGGYGALKIRPNNRYKWVQRRSGYLWTPPSGQGKFKTRGKRIIFKNGPLGRAEAGPRTPEHGAYHGKWGIYNSASGKYVGIDISAKRTPGFGCED